MATCFPSTTQRRTLFWATQPDSCGTDDICGYQCGSPGLTPINDGSSLATTDWLRGLMINMLMTDGRPLETACGVQPGAYGGHWTESYITSGPADVGTLVRTVPPQGRVQDGVNLVVAYANATLSRLVARGVASSVEVTGRYAGAGKVEISALARGTSDGDARVQLTGARMANGWIWTNELQD